jgi:hypothetical protein
MGLGVNTGFVSTAPTADPAEAATATVDGRAAVIKHTSPAGTNVITEIGWWCDGATEEANFEVALYAADGATVPGEAGTLLFSDATNAKGTTAGWKVVSGLNWSISASTAYWIGIQVDDTVTVTKTDRRNNEGNGRDDLAASTLPDPFGGGAIPDADAYLTIYAKYEAAAGGATHTLTQAENMALSTTPTRQADIYRALSSTVATSTAQALAATFRRLQAETAGISDAATRQAFIFRALTDNASVADAIVRQVDILRAVADTAGLSDTPTRQTDVFRAIINTLGLSDSVAAAIAGVGATHLLSLIEQLSAADSVTANRHVYPPQRIMAKGIFSPGMVAAQIRGFQQ